MYAHTSPDIPSIRALLLPPVFARIMSHLPPLLIVQRLIEGTRYLGTFHPWTSLAR